LRHENSGKYLSLESQLSNILDGFALTSGKLNPNTLQSQVKHFAKEGITVLVGVLM
jgi:hypothetical protein